MDGANDRLPEKRHVVLRVGINLGDVIVDGGDLYGDGVNVAARLQSMARPGDICVSGSVYDQVKRKLDLRFDELGPQAIKNIAEPVAVYRVRSPAPGGHEYRGRADSELLPLPAKPSIAVLPFTNMSNDPEQETFVDGLTEDLITDLSRDTGLLSSPATRPLPTRVGPRTCATRPGISACATLWKVVRGGPPGGCALMPS
jgi:hypothetical protein